MQSMMQRLNTCVNVTRGLLHFGSPTFHRLRAADVACCELDAVNSLHLLGLGGLPADRKTVRVAAAKAGGGDQRRVTNLHAAITALPFAANCRTNSAPMPREPPTTTTVFPVIDMT
jgi:hypothetical protein